MNDGKHNGFFDLRSCCYFLSLMHLIAVGVLIVASSNRTDTTSSTALLVAVIYSFLSTMLWFAAGRAAGAMGGLCNDAADIRDRIGRLIEVHRSEPSPQSSRADSDPIDPGDGPEETLSEEDAKRQLDAAIRRRRFRVRGPKKGNGKVVTAIVDAETEIMARRKALRHLTEIHTITDET